VLTQSDVVQHGWVEVGKEVGLKNWVGGGGQDGGIKKLNGKG